MKPYNLDFLFYQMPDEYRLRLDGDDDPDPNYDGVVRSAMAFKEYMKECPLVEYVYLIVKAFKTKYPRASRVWVSLVDTEYVELQRTDKPYRAEIKKIDDHGKLISDDKDENEDYVSQFEVQFKEAQPSLKSWIEAALDGKSFTSSVSGNVTTYTVSESPITRIEVSDDAFSLFIDKDSYIRY